MRTFPLCVDLEQADVLLIGEGAPLTEKIEKLLPFGVQLRVISCEELPRYDGHPQIIRIRRGFLPDDLQPIPVFVAAAGLPETEAAQIYTLCREKNIPINVADTPALCTFTFPALISRGACTISVSTDGKSPAAASYLRQRIEEILPDGIEPILDWAGVLRTDLKSRIPDAAVRRCVLKRAVQAAMEQNRPLTEEELANIIAVTSKAPAPHPYSTH